MFKLHLIAAAAAVALQCVWQARKPTVLAQGLRLYPDKTHKHVQYMCNNFNTKAGSNPDEILVVYICRLVDTLRDSMIYSVTTNWSIDPSNNSAVVVLIVCVFVLRALYHL